MGNRLGIGVIGAGAIALRTAFGHLQEEDVSDKLYVAAVCDPVPGRAAALVEKGQAQKGYLSHEELLADPNVDVVTMCSPIGLHYEQGLAAINAGKHVHFNKTMTVTYDEAAALIEAAKKKGVKIVASPGQMIAAAAQSKRKAILEGKIGRVVWATCGSGNIAQYHLDENERQGNFGEEPIIPAWYYKKPGGGPLYDSTIYGLHMVTGLLGPVKKVVAYSCKTRDSFEFDGRTLVNDADDCTPMLLEFENGAYCIVAAVSTQLPPAFSDGVYGLGGSIVGSKLNGEDYEEFVSLSRSLAPLPHGFGNHPQMRESHVYEDIMQLVDWVLYGGKPPLCSVEHAAHVIEIIDSAYQSAESDKAIYLRSTFAPMTIDEINEALANRRTSTVK
ncbi:MAG: Gfo/Idh/MocA family oxidoreductase [Oscillospiraceae bacterium]|nr:Gfo/Idh/MocA family oxidoreductase [Oscillospiraceae bacterium]